MKEITTDGEMFRAFQTIEFESPTVEPYIMTEGFIESIRKQSEVEINVALPTPTFLVRNRDLDFEIAPLKPTESERHMAAEGVRFRQNHGYFSLWGYPQTLGLAETGKVLNTNSVVCVARRARPSEFLTTLLRE